MLRPTQHQTPRERIRQLIAFGVVCGLLGIILGATLFAHMPTDWPPTY